MTYARCPGSRGRRRSVSVGVASDKLRRGRSGGVEFLRADDQLRAAVGDEEFDAVRRIGRVYRQVGRAGLEYGQHRDDEIDRRTHAQADDVLGADTGPDQPPRQPIRASMQFGVRQPTVVGSQRRRLRGGRGGRLQHVHHRGGGGGYEPAVRLLQHNVPAVGAEHVQRIDAASGLTERTVEQPQIMFGHLLDEWCGQHIGVIVELDEHALLPGHDRHGQRHCRGRRGQVELSCRDAVERHVVRALAHAEAQAHQVVHAVASHRPVWVHFADDTVDSGGLVGNAAENGVAHGVDQSGERVVGAHTHPQQQRVSEIPDRSFRRCTAPGHRHGAQHVLSARIATNEHTEARQQHRERRRGPSPREGLHSAEQFAGNRESAPIHPSGGGCDRWPRQFNRFGQGP